MLADYRQRVKAQFDVLVPEARTQREKFDVIVVEVKLVLDCVDLEEAPQPNGRPSRSDTIIRDVGRRGGSSRASTVMLLLLPLPMPLWWFGPTISPLTFRQ